MRYEIVESPHANRYRNVEGNWPISEYCYGVHLGSEVVKLKALIGSSYPRK